MHAQAGVPREIVERVLTEHGVYCAQQAEEPEYMVLWSEKTEKTEVVWLPDPVHRELLDTLARKYQVPIIRFYNPGPP